MPFIFARLELCVPMTRATWVLQIWVLQQFQDRAIALSSLRYSYIKFHL